MRTSDSIPARLLWLLFLSTALWAVDPETHISQYAHTAWRVQDGYFGGRPLAVTQTTDGYVWIGTEAGLLPFDGVTFAAWTPPAGQRLSSPNVRSLLGASDGSLWIGTRGGLSRLRDHTFSNLDLQDEASRMNASPRFTDRDWRRVTLAASAHLARRVVSDSATKNGTSPYEVGGNHA